MLNITAAKEFFKQLKEIKSLSDCNKKEFQDMLNCNPINEGEIVSDEQQYYLNLITTIQKLVKLVIDSNTNRNTITSKYVIMELNYIGEGAIKLFMYYLQVIDIYKLDELFEITMSFITIYNKYDSNRQHVLIFAKGIMEPYIQKLEYISELFDCYLDKYY